MGGSVEGYCTWPWCLGCYCVRVLRDNSDISLKTRERILKRMKKLNHRSNMMALGLAEYLRVPLNSLDRGTAELGRIAGARPIRKP